MKGLCVIVKHVTAAVFAAILKEKLTLKSPDEIDTAVRNPDTGSTSVLTSLENASEMNSKLVIVGTPASSSVWGRPRA